MWEHRARAPALTEDSGQEKIPGLRFEKSRSQEAKAEEKDEEQKRAAGRGNSICQAPETGPPRETSGTAEAQGEREGKQK